MKLWTFKAHETETTPAWPGAPLRSWRRVLSIGRIPRTPAFGVFLDTELRKGDEPAWHEIRQGYAHLLVNPRYFAFGQRHDYYDGPNCLYSFGWLHLALGPDDCAKCWGDR